MIQQGFSLSLPQNVYATENARERLEALLGEKKRIAVLTDDTLLRLKPVSTLIETIRCQCENVEVFSQIEPEPTVHLAASISEKCKAFQADQIVAIGGGSVMDVAKLASVLCTDDYTIYDLLKNSALARRGVPVIMVPTTAGTGAEATPNAIVTVPEKEMKVGIVNQVMIADTILLDPTMLASLPYHVAAATGADALAHAVECYTSKKATSFSDLYAMEAFRLIEGNIEALCNQNTPQARQAMLIAAFYAGIAITASGTTAVHALSYPLGGKYHIPHGIANAVLLMPVMRFNESFCQERLAQLYDRVRPGGKLTLANEKSHWILDRMDEMLCSIGIEPSLARYHVSMKDLGELTEAGLQVTRLLNNNPRPVTREDAVALYTQVLDRKEACK